MESSGFLSGRIYMVLFAAAGIVYTAGLFVPLMDNDSAHHANIALHMYLTGDYASLVDGGNPYLDKPHLLFWLAAFSYKVFGVTGFAYKFPSLLFTLLGTYSTYRLGRRLYNAETGRLAALLVVCAFAYILANNDVRMDAMLTASIAFATWQLVEFVDTKKMLNVAGAAFGMALGFATKGHIGVFVPAVAILFYILYRKEWRLFRNWKWLAMMLLFGLFISPVVYSYYLQYNLHPEVVVRGENNINGVRFILLNQSAERFSGGMGQNLKNDYSFFIHTFLWAFAPWSILAFIAYIRRLPHFFSRREEWLTTGCFTVVMIVLSLSGFKLPHYVNVLFPVASVMTAAFLLSIRQQAKWIKTVFSIQIVLSTIVVLLMAFVNGWAFTVSNGWVIAAVAAMAALLYLLIKNTAAGKLQKAVLIPAAVMLVSFFLLNTNFYPQLLRYQGGNELAFTTRNQLKAEAVYFWKDHYSPSYSFYTCQLQQAFHDSVLAPGQPAWILTDSSRLPEIKSLGYKLGKCYETPDYGITKLKMNFVNPATRKKHCSAMMLVQVSR